MKISFSHWRMKTWRTQVSCMLIFIINSHICGSWRWHSKSLECAFLRYPLKRKNLRQKWRQHHVQGAQTIVCMLTYAVYPIASQLITDSTAASDIIPRVRPALLFTASIIKSTSIRSCNNERFKNGLPYFKTSISGPMGFSVTDILVTNPNQDRP